MAENETFAGAWVALYALLSRLYTYPLDEAVLGEVAGLVVEEGEVEIGQALALMQQALKGPDLVEKLNEEATRLFEGPGCPAAPPYGSYYLNGRVLMGQEAIEVRGEYLQAGLAPLDEGQLPDHLALELRFMAVLGARGGTEPGIRASRRFLEKHLLSWLPAWQGQLLAAEPQSFFAGLAAFTRAFGEADREWLGDSYPEYATAGVAEDKL